MAKRVTRSAGRIIGRKRRRNPVPVEEKRDPSEDSATSLILADATIRAGSYIVRRTVEKGLLRGRYGSEAAQQLLAHKTIGQTVLSFTLAKLATRSLPGALIVGGGAMAKTLYDRRKAKRTKQAKAVEAPLPPQLPDEQS